MEKQNKTKKRWPILLIALVAVLLVGTVAGLWIGGVFDKEQTEQTDNALYWNLERDEYVAAGADFSSGRLPRTDGLYHITFGCNGEKVELVTADKNVVDKVDMLEVMGLEFDENGYITGVKTVEQCGYQILNRILFVERVEGNVIYANNSHNYTGMEFELTYDENTQIYDVSGGALLGYFPCTPKAEDELVVIADMDGSITHIFVKPYVEPGSVYWNTERKYNSTTKMSTREADELGYFTYVFAIDGQQVTLRCRDQKLANELDKQNPACMDLVFDEEGLITGKLSVNTVTGGKSVSSWYDVTGIDGNTFTTKRVLAGSSQGLTNEHVMTDTCKIINTTGTGDFKGEYTDLRVGDRVHCLTDSRGRVCYVFVVGRTFEGQIGWNVARQWDSTNKVSKRTPAEDGYYYVKMAIAGQQVTVKTKDKTVVDKLDSFICYGLKLDENNEVLKITSAATVYNGGVFGSYYDVTAIDGNTITVKRVLSGSNEGKVVTGTMRDDCEIYNVSDNSSFIGEPTELEVGDRIHAFKTTDGKIKLIYVVNRPVTCSIYWNINRQYNSTTKETKRVPDADGWYYFDFAVDGKQVTLKTNQKEIADKIDGTATRQMGILHWKGQITKVISCNAIKGYEGGPKGVSWVDIIAIDGQTYTARKYDTGKVYTFTIGNSCKVYNVDPAGVIKYVGEPTTLQIGDRVHAHHNVDGLAMLVFVVDNRVAALDTAPNSCACAENVTWEPWDGVAPLEDGKYYYLTQDVVAPEEGFKLEGITVYLRLDGHTISSNGRVFWAYSNSKLNICDHDTRGKLIGSGVDGEPGGVMRTASTAVVNLWNIDVQSDGDHTAVPTEGGLVSVACSFTAHNVNFIGGKVAGKGGNVYISTYGTFRAFDCTFENGEAGTSGGNIYVMNRIYLENAVLTGGKAAADGDNLVIDTSKECIISGMTASNPANGKNVYIKAGSPGIEGKLTVTDGSTYNVKLGNGKMMDLGMTADSKVGVTGDNQCVVLESAAEELLSCFTLEHPANQQLLYLNGDIRITSTLPPKEHSSHCVCAGKDLGLADHICAEITEWKELTLDALTTSTTGSDRLMFKESGSYYLPYDLKLSGVIDILPGQNITVCLNGCKLESASRVFMVVGELTVTDCDTTGVVTTAYASNGGVVKLSNSGTFNLYGGTLIDTATVATGGGAVVVSTDGYGSITPSEKKTTVFNMYGGTLSGNETSGSGGNVTLFHDNCFFNMYGGTIENGEATNYGGNIKCYSSVSLLGGTVTGGTAAKGDDVYFNNGTLTIGGKVDIGQITLTNDLKLAIHDAGLTVSQPIEIVADEGVFAENVTTDLSGSFKAVGYDVVYNAADMTLSLNTPTHDAHCACNGQDLGLAEHTCEAVSDWKPLTDACFTVAKTSSGAVSGVKFIESGNYFLTADYTLTAPIYTQVDQNITICLNGYELSSAKSVAAVSGTLTLTDCVGTGKAAGNTTTNGGCLKVVKGGTLNIYGGTYSNDQSVTAGGGVVVVSRDTYSACGIGSATPNTGVFNMYGGTLSGGKTVANGGNVIIFHTECVFNMYGGTMENGAADGNGGNLKSAGTMNLLGGTITGGSAAKGDDIYYNTGTVTIGGELTIGQITLVDKKLVISDEGLTVKTPIKLTAGEGVFATNVQSDLSACFEAEGLEVVYNAADKTLSLKASGHPAHCVCNKADLGLASHTCEEITEWIPLSSDCFTDAKNSSGEAVGVKFKESGSYYLTGDFELTKSMYIQVGQEITICLNGYELSSAERVAFTSGTLTVTDCGTTGKAIGASTSNGGCIKITKGGTLNIYGGTFSNPNKVSTGGGVIVVSRDGSSACGSGSSTPNVGVFNLYGGTLSGGKTSGSGGTVTVFHAECTMNMYGGTIENGVATSNGGNLRSHGTVNLLGGTITGGSAAKGDDVYINGGTLTIGGELTIGSIHVNGKSFKIHSGGLTVKAPIEIVGSDTFATGVAVDLSGCFKAADSTLSVVYDAEAKTLKLA